MKPSHTSSTLVVLSVASALAFALPQRAFCQTGPGGNAQVLLEEAKKTEFERKMAAKQTVADRLNEDLKKGKQEGEDLDKSISKVSSATASATGQLDKLGAEKKRLTLDLDLVGLQIDAEKLKVEGLKLLAAAHAKSREALAKRTEEIDLKKAVVAAEMRVLAGKPSAEPAAPSAKGSRSKSSGPTLTELRKQLSKAEQATINASYNARQAMDAASEKLQRAEAAAAKAEKKRAELALEKNPSLPGGNDPLNPTKR
jgi:chromosome segregation ATPase